MLFRRDLTITEDGDIALDENGDLKVSEGAKAMAEAIMVRLRTYLNESPLFPGIGSRFTELAGRPNTLETGQAVEAMAYEALTADNFLLPEAIEITAVPISESVIYLYVDPDPTATEGFPGALRFDIDLTQGQIS